MPSFSERSGYTSPRLPQVKSLDDRTRTKIWNIILEFFDSLIVPVIGLHGRKPHPALILFFKEFWTDFLVQPLGELPRGMEMVPILQVHVSMDEWHWVHSFQEFFLARLVAPVNCRERLTNLLNTVFREEMVQFQIIDGLVVPDPGEIESDAIQAALNSPLKVVHDHIRRSLEFLANKPSADHRNSIRESMAAVEALCKTIANDRSADLGDALKELEKMVQFHPCLKLSLVKLYAYTSDGGIRHASIEGENGRWSDEETAKFMLIATSAFIRLISEKARLAGLRPFSE